MLKSAVEGRIKGSFWVLILIVTLCAVVTFPPASSKDVNSYAFYGRLVERHQLSPYTHTPADVPDDPWSNRVSYFWSDSPSVYGPVFTALSAGVMKVAGTSFTVARVGFQLLDVLALLLAVALLARAMNNTGLAVVLVGLNPLILTFGVNDAHADVIIGTSVLLGALLISRRRLLLGAVAIAVAVMIKVSVLPALVGAVVWIWYRYRLGAAAKFLLAALSTLVIGAAWSGGLDVLRPLSDASSRFSRFSVWNPVQQIFGDVHLLGAASVAVVGSYLIWRYRKEAMPYMAVASGLVIYQVLGAYTLSWYALWALPLLALVWRSWLAAVSMGCGCWLAVAYFSGYGAIAFTVIGIGWVIYRRIVLKVPIAVFS